MTEMPLKNLDWLSEELKTQRRRKNRQAEKPKLSPKEQRSLYLHFLVRQGLLTEQQYCALVTIQDYMDEQDNFIDELSKRNRFSRKR